MPQPDYPLTLTSLYPGERMSVSRLTGEGSCLSVAPLYERRPGKTPVADRRYSKVAQSCSVTLRLEIAELQKKPQTSRTSLRYPLRVWHS